MKRIRKEKRKNEKDTKSLKDRVEGGEVKGKRGRKNCPRPTWGGTGNNITTITNNSNPIQYNLFSAIKSDYVEMLGG